MKQLAWEGREVWFQFLELPQAIFKKQIKIWFQVGIWIPETNLDERMKVDNVSLTVDVYIQLNGPNKVRLVNYMASIKKVNICSSKLHEIFQIGKQKMEAI